MSLERGRLARKRCGAIPTEADQGHSADPMIMAKSSIKLGCGQRSSKVVATGKPSELRSLF